MSGFAGVVLLVALGGAIGALVRWSVSVSISQVPWGVMGANVVASAAAAFAQDLDGPLEWLLIAGFLGALSTWSTLAVVVVELWRQGMRGHVVGVLISTVGACVGAAYAVM